MTENTTRLPQLEASQSLSKSLNKSKNRESSPIPAEISNRVPFSVPTSVSPTRYTQIVPEVNHSIPLATMSNRQTFVDNAISRAQNFPGPASYRTVSFTLPHHRRDTKTFTPQARPTILGPRASVRTEFPDRANFEKSYNFTTKSVFTAELGRGERFTDRKDVRAEFNGDVVEGFKAVRSKSVHSSFNTTERFKGERPEPERKSKGKRWNDF